MIILTLNLIFSTEVFLELIHRTSSMVEFNFDNIIYKQIDEVAMVSPLGAALVKIFGEYYEEKLFLGINQTCCLFQI